MNKKTQQTLLEDLKSHLDKHPVRQTVVFDDVLLYFMYTERNTVLRIVINDDCDIVVDSVSDFSRHQVGSKINKFSSLDSFMEFVETVT
jgi:hypothetical protein